MITNIKITDSFYIYTKQNVKSFIEKGKQN
jgi:hypothetical protein